MSFFEEELGISSLSVPLQSTANASKIKGMGEESKPKKIYTPEECKQLLEDIKVAIKEKIVEFTDNSNISIKGIKYNDIHLFIDITEL